MSKLDELKSYIGEHVDICFRENGSGDGITYDLYGKLMKKKNQFVLESDEGAIYYLTPKKIFGIERA